MRMSDEEFRAYAASPKFQEDLAEAARLVREGTPEELAAWLSRDVEERAKRAAAAARNPK